MWIKLIGLSSTSGLLLFLSDYPIHLWPLQLLALAPLLYTLERVCRSHKTAALAGLLHGLWYLVPLELSVEFPIVMALGLAFYLTLLWVIMAVGIYRVARWPSLWGPLAVAAVAVIVEWINMSVIPVWGTAQCFARVWTAAPCAIQFVELTGVTGLVFLLFSSQALFVRALTDGGRRRLYIGTLLLLMGVVGGYNLIAHRRAPSSSLRVAAMGWTADYKERSTTPARELFSGRYRPLVEQAVKQGARLVVSPEVGFRLKAADKAVTLAQIGALARQHRVMLAVGYFDFQRNDNRIAFFNEQGKLQAEYAKTHLIVLIEDYKAGSGELTLLDLAGVKLGGMICQDDNFTDLSRAYGERGVQIMAVPTQDWRQVKNYHLDNSLFRTIEGRYAMVRGALNGISVIASPRGEILAQRDHFKDGPGLIVADVPLYAGVTLYSRLGDWPAALCLILVLVGVVLRRRHATASS